MADLERKGALPEDFAGLSLSSAAGGSAAAAFAEPFPLHDHEFTVVTRARAPYNRKSGLYNYLLENRSTVDAKTTTFVEHSTSYILINIANTDYMKKTLQDMGHTLLEQHLRIDAHYNAVNNTNLFAYAHISIKTEDGSGKVWKHRVYFNHIGKIICSVNTKYLDKEAREPECVVELEKSLKQIIVGIALMSKQILLDLLKTRDAAYQTAQNEFNAVEALLEVAINNYINNPKQELFTECNAIRGRLEKSLVCINNFAERDTDVRDSLSRNMLEALEIRMQPKRAASSVLAAASAAASATISTEDESAAEAAVATDVVMPAGESVFTEQEDFKKLSELEQQFSPYANRKMQKLAPEELIRAHAIAKELQVQVVFCSFSYNGSKQHHLLAINNKISKFLDLKLIFMQAVSNNDLLAVRALYVYVKNKLEYKFYHNYMFDLIDNADPKLEVCQFFYEQQDELYFMSLRRLEHSYQAKEGIPGFLFSILTNLMVKPNMAQLLVMLLEHGLDPNIPGCFYNTMTIPMLFQTIYFYASHSPTKDANEKYIVLIEKLVKSGAQLELCRQPVAVWGNYVDDEGKKITGIVTDKHISRKVSQMSKTDEAAKLCISLTTSYVGKITHANSALQLLVDSMKDPDPRVVAILSEGTSLVNIGKSLVKLSDHDHVALSRESTGSIYELHGAVPIADFDKFVAELETRYNDSRSAKASKFLRRCQIYIGLAAATPHLIKNISFLVAEFKRKYNALQEMNKLKTINLFLQNLLFEANEYCGSLGVALLEPEQPRAEEFYIQARTRYETMILFYTMLPDLAAAKCSSYVKMLQKLHAITKNYAECSLVQKHGKSAFYLERAKQLLTESKIFSSLIKFSENPMFDLLLKAQQAGLKFSPESSAPGTMHFTRDAVRSASADAGQSAARRSAEAAANPRALVSFARPEEKVGILGQIAALEAEVASTQADLDKKKKDKKKKFAPKS